MAKRKKATRHQTKKHNRRLVLSTIYDVGEISRAGIARTTDLTRPTVSAIVAELMDDGLVQEVGRMISSGGKPATLLSIISDSRHLIGLDLANSEFRGAVINLRGEILHRVNIPIRARDGEAALDLVHQLLSDLIERADSPLGVGIGAPGLFDAQKGIVRTAVNLDWRDLPLGDILNERYGVPVYIANDSQVAALGEFTFGQHDDVENLAVLKVGRGVGVGIIIGGDLYYGDGHGAGEIGHFKVVEGGEPCRCGHFGCLETVSSTQAIVRQAKMVAANSPTASLHRFAASPEEITTNIVLDAVKAGDSALEEIVADAGRYLGFAAAGLVSILNIETVVVAGSAARFGSLLLDPLKQEMQRRSLPQLAQNTHVTASALGADIVILGAAALLLHHELGLVG